MFEIIFARKQNIWGLQPSPAHPNPYAYACRVSSKKYCSQDASAECEISSSFSNSSKTSKYENTQSKNVIKSKSCKLI